MTRKKLDLKGLRAFVAWTDEGGATKAAKFLGVSQSTVSESVLALERAAGGPVFVRPGREVVLTAIGETLLPFARQILAIENAAITKLAEASVASRITIATSESVASYLLPSFLAPLRARWPKTKFRVEVMVCEDVKAGVKKGLYDLGLLIDQEGALPNPVTSIAICAVVHPKNDLLNSLGEKPLALHNLIEREIHISAGSYVEAIRNSASQLGFGEPAINTVGGVEAVKRTIRADKDAVGILAAFTVQEELARKELAILKTRPAFPPMMLFAEASVGLGKSVKNELAPQLRELLHELQAKASSDIAGT